MEHARRNAILAAIGVAAVGVLLSQALPLLAADHPVRTVDAAADTTASQVTQDGDSSVRTTLASCPQLCDGNPSGERNPVVEFAVTRLPATATRVRATLRLYSWQAVVASVAAFPASGGARSTGAWLDRPTLGPSLGTHPGVTKGYNTWDVSTVLRGNGTYTFALLQQTRNSRVYWASRENANAAVRPQLVITYQRSATPSPPSAGPSAAGPSATATPTPAVSAVPGWRLVWSDEFTGASLDTTRWNARDASWVDYDRACITSRPQNVFVAAGVLTLRAAKEAYTCGSQRREYTDAYLDTIGTASFTYGRFEVRAKSPTGPTNSKGLWPAFWLRPDDGGHGELDVVELPGGSQYYKAATQAIFYDYTPVKQDHRYTFPAGSPSDGFHTYTTEWESGVIRWYIDGVGVWQRDRSTTTWLDEALGRRFHLRLNFQVGGWLGDPDATTVFPADFQVDYVRVWSR
jgi:beta-glucanase (GH16 family)